MSDEIGKSSPAALGDEWEASGCQVRLSARPDFAIAYCATERGAARVAAALNAAPLGQARGAEGETVSALRSSLAKAEAALANISGALVDSGLPVPEEADYHKAVRALTAERDRLWEALRRHGVHLDTCKLTRNSHGGGPCTCGFWELTAPVVAQSVSAPSAHAAATGSEGQETANKPGEGKP